MVKHPGREAYKTTKVRRGRRSVDKEGKSTTLQRTLRNVQKELNPYERLFSKFLHNTVVEQLSEASAKTLARPLGLLFGGTASFVISLAVLLLCRYFGYEYNYLIGLLSFPVGFAIGIAIEAILIPLRSRSK